MASTVAESVKQRYSCRCLNVRIQPATIQTVASELNPDPEFTQVFVGGEGIAVVHPQVTVRTRTKGIPIVGTSRCSRFTTITCLICGILVYRVYQTYPIDVEGRDGPLLPTEDWVERDIMKSSTGWVEVHKHCLTGDAFLHAISSPNYSATFSLLLPDASPLPTSPDSTTSSYSAPPPPPSPKSYLPNRPLFLPPPFTPSHPVFLHLSSLAGAQYRAIRVAAEEHINEVVQSKISEIERADTELRQHVESLWKFFRENLSHIPHDRTSVPKHSNSNSRSRERPSANGISNPGTAVAVRDFVPTVISPVKTSPAQVPRMSALSASLATSSFHHPRARHLLPSPSGSSGSASSHSGPSTLVSPPPLDGSNVLKFKRNIDDSINTAASYRFFMNMEEEMARHRRGRPMESNKSEADQGHQPSLLQAAAAPNQSGNNKPQKQFSGSQSSTEDTNVRAQEDDPSESRGRDSKGKRKVTFDVQPAVVTIKREVIAEKEEEDALANQGPREMIFDIEDLDEEGSELSANSKPTLPLVEQASLARPARPRKARLQNTAGLPGSFLGLRPASLPAPSHIRPPRSTHGSDSSSHATMLSMLRPSSPLLQGEHRRTNSDSISNPAEKENPVDPRDAEILKLVAANTPSHRGAWKPGSKAWQTFVRRQGSKDHTGSGDIPEEDEDDGGDTVEFGAMEMGRASTTYHGDYDQVYGEYGGLGAAGAQFVGSMPIPIKLRSKLPQTLSLASYRPKTSLTEHPESLVPPLVPRATSSAALRKAAYAERDRSRSMDPGALDFAAEEDEGEDEEEDDVPDENNSKLDGESGGRGRKRALKILQVQSKIPEAGMWRSLAS